MHFITSKCYIHIRIIVDKSLVHWHRGCEFEPRHSRMLFFFILFFYQLFIEPWHVISNILTCVDSDEPVHPPFKLRQSKYCLGSS